MLGRSFVVREENTVACGTIYSVPFGVSQDAYYDEDADVGTAIRLFTVDEERV